MLLSETAVRNRATVAVMMILIVAAGGYCYFTLPREAAPDVPIPIILVTTAYEGVSPEDMESSVTMKIEQELSGLKGLKEITSTSAEGMSTVVIEFEPDIEIEDALQYVRDRVDLAKPELPDDAEEPYIKEINVAEFPIMMISISGDISPVRMKVLADELEDAIERIKGVLDADVLGALEREIRLEVDPDRLASFNLTIPELLALIPSENVNISAGGLETEGTRFNVRVPAEFISPDEVDRLLLTTREGKPVYLSDVAKVTDAFKDREGYSRLNGESSITVSVQKRVGADIIPISDQVKMILAKAREDLPAGVRVEITDDVAKYIRMMVRDLENNILSGLILIVVVLLAFLGLRTSAIVALTIPMSMLMSFAAITALGYTLNMIVLFGLVMALGMLVDNAIVIVENIYRHVQLGYGRFDAAIKGANEVGWPVATSTATTVAAFSPLLFWPGIMGDFMKYLPITLIITLSSSLFVALVISPTVSSVFASAARKSEDGPEHVIIRTYRRALEWALTYWYATLSLAVLVLVAVGLLYELLGQGVELFPDMDPDRANINIRCPQGTNLRESDRLARIAEEGIAPFSEQIDHVVATVGSSGGARFFGGGASGPHVGNLTIIFTDYEDRLRPSAGVVGEMRRALAGMTGAEVKVEREKEGPPTGAPVTVQIMGDDFKRLEEISGRARQMIADVPGLVNLRSDYEAARPELVFHVDRRRAMLLGVNTAQIGNFLKMAVFGRKVGTFREYTDEYDITVRLPVARRVKVDDLFNLMVPNAAGDPVPLSALGRFDYEGGFGTINRINQKRAITLTADNEEGTKSDDVLKLAQQRLEKLDLPEGYRINYAGEKEEQEEAQAFLLKAFVVALLLIVMILVTQFNSFAVPLIIMTSVMLSLAGVLAGLLVFRMPFGIIMTGVGVISLAGVVVNNAIVLMAYTRQLQQRGRSLRNAAVEAGVTRFRPVVLTAVTTMLGLLPMATGISYDFHVMSWALRSQSSEWWASMAIVVIFGLACATVLTLVVVPTLYVTLFGVAEALGLKSVSAARGEVGADPAGE